MSRTRDWSPVCFALAFPTVVTVVYFELLAGTPSTLYAYGAGKFLQFAFPLAWVVVGQRRRPSFVRPKPRDLALGALLGLALFAGTLTLYHALEPAGLFDAASVKVRDKLDELSIGSAPAFLVTALFYVLVHSGLEEYYWRWFVFGQLRRLGTLRRAILISSVGFTAHHVCILSDFFGWSSGAGMLLTVITSTAVGIGGVIWSWLYERTGSLWTAWISHALMDAAIFAVGYQMRLM